MITTAIHQFVHTLSYGDAISTEVLALQRAFQAQGRTSEVFAINVHPKLSGRARLIGEFHDTGAEVILHYSLGSPLNQIYRDLTGKRTLIYHNLTPARWFEGVNPRIVRDIKSGIEELPELCRLSHRCIADSPFNAAELQVHGVQAEVLELAVDPERWNTERNSGVYQLVKSDPGIHLLHVGRLAPNKCVEDIIKIFAYLHHVVLHPAVERRSRLWLVGIDIDTELYSFALKRLVRELDVEEYVHFVGCFSDGEVRALYEACSVYLCMSEHEGFCLPLIEAMHFGLPVIAYRGSAVETTLAEGGVLVREKHHAHIAELAYLLATDAGLRAKVVAAGKKRVERYSYERFTARASELFSLSSAPTNFEIGSDVEHRTVVGS